MQKIQIKKTAIIFYPQNPLQKSSKNGATQGSSYLNHLLQRKASKPLLWWSISDPQLSSWSAFCCIFLFALHIIQLRTRSIFMYAFDKMPNWVSSQKTQLELQKWLQGNILNKRNANGNEGGCKRSYCQVKQFLKLRAEVFKITASISPRTKDPSLQRAVEYVFYSRPSQRLVLMCRLFFAVYTQQLVLSLNSVSKLIQVGSVIYKQVLRKRSRCVVKLYNIKLS